jgi:uncharacterized phage protein (TIGR02218 family)
VKTIPQPLAEHLSSGATTLCWCWRLVRTDDIVLGFTDHDRAVLFDGTVFEASAGFTASEVRESVGLSVDNLEVEGAITSERLNEGDLAAGLYDDATVEIFRVNWQEPEQRVLIRKGSVGEVRRAGQAFVTEIRGLAHALNQPRGRLYQYNCDAELGDGRCGIDIETSAFSRQATVTASLSVHSFDVTGVEAFASGWFDRGSITFATGDNAGRTFQIKMHENRVSTSRLTLWQAPPSAVGAADTLTIRAGCDKTIETCRVKFQNAVNFRGFPHMPGNDYVTTIHGGE